MFSNMKKLALVAMLATSSVTSAVAADLPAGMYGKAAPSAVYNWGGFYLGGDVGGAFTGPTATSNFVQTNGATTTTTVNQSSPAGVLAGGVHAGYNFQVSPQWVIGIEGDWQALGKSGTCGSIFQGDPCIDGPANDRGIITTNTSINSMGSVRGRLGLAFDNVMLYGTGGAAFANVSNTVGLRCLDDGCGSSTTHFSIVTPTSATKTGWVAGVGAEWHVIGNWIARGEWLHYDLGNISTGISALNVGTCDCTASANQKLHYDVMRLGFNYKFGY